MPDSFAELQFSGQWRPYQARVLEELEAHLADDRVHIVAPPGSGKTLIGLEVVRRLRRPALILAPTLALCDQWLDRFSTHFVGPSVPVARDLRKPSVLTVATYQALHVAHTSEPGVLVEALGGIGTLVVDEAHHLRRAWWESLRDVRSALPGVHVVALTATPPYDVPTAEWVRYSTFCGPPDAEISTPELVRAGHLCPHQDAVHLSLPVPAEQAEVDRQREEAVAFADALLESAFVDALLKHPWVSDAATLVDEIADDGPEWFVAVLAFLQVAGHDVSDAATVLNIGPEELPLPRLSDVSHVCEGAFARLDMFPEAERMIVRELEADLRRIGGMHGRRVWLHRPPAILKFLGRSASKIESVAEVVAFEAEHREADLRAVILADRIHEEAWDPAYAGEPQPGVAPLVSRLHRLNAAPVGALTGSFAVIPASAMAALRQEEPAALDVVPLAAAPDLLRVSSQGEASRLVGPVTRLFERGEVRVLVGTVALLGEGWDAPAANVLVSASHAATFVQTGQMRGRVLRLDPARPGKVATVWHLACVEAGAEEGGADLARLGRRFAAFAGPREGNPPRLETGLGRLGVPAPPFSPERVEVANAHSFAAAVSLDQVRRLWQEAVGREVDGQALRPVVRVSSEQHALPPRIEIRRVHADSLVPLGWIGGMGTMAAATVAGLASGIGTPFALVSGLGAMGLGAGALAVTGWRAVARRRLARMLGTEGLRLRVLAEVVREGLLALEPTMAQSRVWIDRDGASVHATLDGARVADAEVFTTALAEALGDGRTPRYLLDCGGAWVPVPSALGQRKALAEAFAEAWRARIGPATLVFTRTPGGRRRLAEARAHWAWADHRVERIRRWA